MTSGHDDDDDDDDDRYAHEHDENIGRTWNRGRV